MRVSKSKVNIFIVSLLVFVFAYALSFRNVSYSDNIHYSFVFEELVRLSSYDYVDFFSLNKLFLINISSVFEFLFYYFTYAIVLFSSSYEEYLFYHSAVFISLLLVAYQRMCKNVFLAFFLVTVTLTTYSLYGNILRQAAALPFFIFAISCLYNSEGIKKYFVFILIGSLFHTSLIVFIVIPFLAKIKDIYLVITLVVLMFFSMSGLTSLVISTLNFVPILSKLLIYINSSDLQSFGVNFVSPLFFVAPLFLIKNKKPKIQCLLSVYLSILIVQYSFANNFIIFTRIGLYRTMLEPLIILVFISYFPVRIRIVQKIVLLIISSLYFFFFTMPIITNPNGLFPM